MSIEHKEIKYPIGIQTFSNIREGGFVYVDKTALIPELLKGKFFFLSRPRRFGKSLFLSTLRAYFEGKRELFKGLAIDSLTEDWEPHPIFHLDLNSRLYKDESSLIAELNAHLEMWEEVYGDEKKDREPEERFAYLIRRACEQTGKKVVILVDEYDKPLLSTISKPELAECYRSQLKAFYSTLKSMDAYIRHAVITGVARFTKVSIFSDLNNLRDISFEDTFGAICGVTTNELYQYFEQGIAKLAKKSKISVEEMIEVLRHNYDGYHFSINCPDIYNPFSLLNAFAKEEIGPYWSQSGTPEFLVRLLQRGEWELADISPIDIDRHELISAGIMSEEPIPILYQTGYLTIKNYDSAFNQYTLAYPNEEVRQAFLKFLLPYYLYPQRAGKPFNIRNFIMEISNGDAEGFMTRMETLIAGVPYSEKGSAEAHFQNAVYLLFTLMGFYCRIEQRTSNGRIDLRLETERYIYIMEFKIDSTPEAAMEQIEKKGYWKPDTLSGKQIILIGANFDTSTRTLSPTPIIRKQ